LFCVAIVDVSECAPQYSVDQDGLAGLGEYALVDPVPGTLVIFPSWVLHCVLPIVGDAEGHRISCAFNARSVLSDAGC